MKTWPWNFNDMQHIEKSPSSPAWIDHNITSVMYNSTSCRCKVDSVNPVTGEYRIVLQGTIDTNQFGDTPKFN